jgi:hypothetical protein
MFVTSPKVKDSDEAPSPRPVPLKQAMALRKHGIRQMSAAMELVGIGELFADPRLAIGLALRLRDTGLSVSAQRALIEAGERYLDERGLLEAAHCCWSQAARAA